MNKTLHFDKTNDKPRSFYQNLEKQAGINVIFHVPLTGGALFQ